MDHQITMLMMYPSVEVMLPRPFRSCPTFPQQGRVVVVHFVVAVRDDDFRQVLRSFLSWRLLRLYCWIVSFAWPFSSDRWLFRNPYSSHVAGPYHPPSKQIPHRK